MRNNIKIAVTGGIGSGKSLAMSIISELGYNTVSLDDVYANLLKEEWFIIRISNEFAIEPIHLGGQLFLDKKKLASIVFHDKSKLEKLNRLTHSEIFKRAFSIYEKGMIFFEVPLLFEGNYVSQFDKVFVIRREKKIRVESVMMRDNVTLDEALLRINNQVDYDNLDLSLHTIIYNDSTKESLKNNLIRAIDSIEKV